LTGALRASIAVAMLVWLTGCSGSEVPRAEPSSPASQASTQPSRDPLTPARAKRDLKDAVTPMLQRRTLDYRRELTFSGAEVVTIRGLADLRRED